MPKVSDAIKMVENDGWELARTKGSHRQFKHESKSGTVTIAGKKSKDLPPSTWNSIKKQAGLAIGEGIMDYRVIIEESNNGYAAYLPALPGCIAAGDTFNETKQLIEEAAEWHVDDLIADGHQVEPIESLSYSFRRKV